MAAIEEPYEILEKKEKYFLFIYALDKINPNYKEVITMKYLQGFSQRRIAKSRKPVKCLQRNPGAFEAFEDTA